MQRIRFKRVTAMTLLFALMTASAGCGKKEDPPELLTPVSAEQEYVTVERGRIGSRTYYDAYVTPEIEEVWFNYDGVLEECLKVCGDRVEEGEVLARLRTDELDAEIEAANKELAFLQTDYEYNVSLAQKQICMDQVAISMNYEEAAKLDADIAAVQAALDQRMQDLAAGTISENDVEDEADYEQKLQEYEMQRYHTLEGISDFMHNIGRNEAKTEADTGIYGIDVKEKTGSLSRLQERKESAVITSPCSGRVLGTVSPDGEQLNSGDNISALETVYYIADESRAYFTVEGLYDTEFKNDMQVYVLINGKEYPLVKADYNARLKMEEEEEWGPVNGLPLRFRTENEEWMKELQFGDFYQIVVVEKQAEDVLYVPNHAIYRDGSISYVIRMEGEKEVKTLVDTGMTTICYTEIKDGVEEGDRLLSKNVYFDTGNFMETELVSGNYIAKESFSRMSTASYRNERIFCPVSEARLKEMKVKNGDEVKAGDSIALLELYSQKSSIMELNYRLTNIDVNYDDARTALDKQKTMLAESVCELEAQNDTSGQIGMLMMQIDYLDTLLAQMNARREYEKETVKDALKRLNDEAALFNVKAGSDGRITDIAGIKEGRGVTGQDTFCIIRDETEQLIRIDDSEKLKYNMEVEITGILNGEEVTLTGKVVAADNVLPPWIYDGTAYGGYAVVKPDEAGNLEGFEGEEAKVSYVMYENAYVVDSNMVFYDTYGSYVYVVRDGERVRRYVTATEFKNSRAYILDGLWEDETVLSQREG